MSKLCQTYLDYDMHGSSCCDLTEFLLLTVISRLLSCDETQLKQATLNVRSGLQRGHMVQIVF